MNDSSQHNEVGDSIADRAAIVARYKRLRAVGSKLSDELVQRISKDVLHEGGEKLGILQRGILVFNTEDETAILMDYCLYNVHRNGRNAIEQYLLDSPPAPDSEEMACLRAMQRAIYSMFVVESAVPNFGVTVRDLLSKKTDPILIVDMGLGSTAQPGLVFASRLRFHEGFAITGGAALPISVMSENQRHELVEKLARTVIVDEGRPFDPAPLIREYLKRGYSSRIQYQEPTGRLVGRQREPEPRGRLVERPREPEPIRSEKTSRNAPCPCGSGKKFKNCCLKRS